MFKITAIKKESPWYKDREFFIGETFEVLTSTSRYFPVTEKAKNFAKEQGVEYFVFVNGAESIPT